MELDGILESLEELYKIIYYGFGIAELGIGGITLIWGAIVAVVSAIFGMMISLLVFILQSVPLYKISSKMGRKSAWLVWLTWLPIIGKHISTYVLADVLGDKPIMLADRIILKNRLLSFWIRIGISVFGSTLVTVFIGFVNLVPMFGQVIGAFSTLLYLVPTAAAAALEFVYLRDVLDLFNQDRISNRNAAFIVAILDALVTLGFARAFYLYTVMNKEPLIKAYNYTVV